MEMVLHEPLQARFATRLANGAKDGASLSKQMGGFPLQKGSPTHPGTYQMVCSKLGKALIRDLLTLEAAHLLLGMIILDVRWGIILHVQVQPKVYLLTAAGMLLSELLDTVHCLGSTPLTCDSL